MAVKTKNELYECTKELLFDIIDGVFTEMMKADFYEERNIGEFCTIVNRAVNPESHELSVKRLAYLAKYALFAIELGFHNAIIDRLECDEIEEIEEDEEFEEFLKGWDEEMQKIEEEEKEIHDFFDKLNERLKVERKSEQ